MRIYRDSLAKTVDSVNEAFFFGMPVTAAERDEVALWIAKRQGEEGSYANMFAPTASDARKGIRLFTGEALGPSASLRHVSGEEACRALILLQSRSKEVQKALEDATVGMRGALERARLEKRKKFCCGTCDPALWRHITAGGLKGEEEWLENGMKMLKGFRDGKGRWQRFPYFWTMLALSEMDFPAARQEMRYAASVGERYLARKKPSDPMTRRRVLAIERVLAKC
ncbi:MAG: hypothetical protein IPH75_10610 [bacterium]|nr:hypothetical protein [bacterium]